MQQKNLTQNVEWAYKNIKSDKKEEIYFSPNSIIGGFIAEYSKLQDGENKARIKEALDRLANFKEDAPGEIGQITALEARLNLMIFLPDGLASEESFDFKKYPQFSALMSSCKPEQLKQIAPYLNFLKDNPYNLALAIKLFFSHQRSQSETENFFKIIKNIENSSLSEENRRIEAARAMLIAAKLDEKIAIKALSKNTYFSDLKLEEHSPLYKLLIDPQKITEKEIREPWFKDFLLVTVNFPLDEIKKEIENYKPQEANKPLVMRKYKIFPYDDKTPCEVFLVINSMNCLGEGGFGKVHKAYVLDKNGDILIAEPYAVKIMNDYDVSTGCITLKEFKDSLNEEVRKNRQAGIKALEPRVFQMDSKDKYVLPLQFVSGQTVSESKSDQNSITFKKFLKDASLADRARLAFEYKMAIQDIHKKHLLHGDIKSQNVLFSKELSPNGKWRYNVRLVDFGGSADLPLMDNPHENIKFEFGTPDYMAPEILTQTAYHVSDTYSSAYFYKCFFWGVNPLTLKGNCAWPMKPRTPYSNKGMKNIAEAIDDPDYKFMKDCIIDFTNRCEEPDPLKRIGEEEEQAFLSHLVTFTELLKMKKNPDQLKSNDFIEAIINARAAKCILISTGLWNEKALGEIKFSEVTFASTFSRTVITEYKNLLSIILQDNKAKENFKDQLRECIKPHYKFKSEIEEKIHDLRKEFINKIESSFYGYLVPNDYIITFIVPGLKSEGELKAIGNTNIIFKRAPADQTNITCAVSKNGTELTEDAAKEFLFENKYTKEFMEIIEKENIFNEMREALIVTDETVSYEKVKQKALDVLKTPITHRTGKSGNTLNTYDDVLKESRSGFSSVINKISHAFFGNRNSFFSVKTTSQKIVEKAKVPLNKTGYNY